MKPIWFITGVRDNGGPNPYDDIGCQGWFVSLEDAVQCLENNPLTIGDHGYYKYMVVESQLPGICAVTGEDPQIWYQFKPSGLYLNNWPLGGEYVKIDRPEFARGIVGWWM